jgi:hypothetical protein
MKEFRITIYKYIYIYILSMSTNYFDNKTAFLEPVVTQYGSRMVMTNVTKPRKTKFFNIDTRFTNEYAYNKMDYNKIESYTVNLPERITEVNSIHISQIEIPMSFFNISSALGNSNFLLTNVTEKTSQIIQIRDGNYTAFDITTTLNKMIAGLVFNSDSDNSYISITNNTQNVFSFDFAVDNMGFFDKFQIKSKLGWVMGFRNQNYELTPTLSITAESVFNENTTRYLYLVLDEFSNTFPNSFCSVFTESVMNKNILARISINKSVFPYGSILFGNENNGIMRSDTRSYLGKIDLQRINIQLVNEVGKPMNLNGMDFSFLLKVEHE